VADNYYPAYMNSIHGPYSEFSGVMHSKKWKGLLQDEQKACKYITPPSFERMINDSAKLRYLDELLYEKKLGGHRVLIFCQMTKMMNILEEYLSRMHYSYFRLDGNSNISERNQMVQEFQENPTIFAFVLSTRAGGLGVTLTAADTVVFFDNDWNPTMDAQATDRAHRIGQTKNVNVYR
jgi:DNA helicase INO80